MVCNIQTPQVYSVTVRAFSQNLSLCNNIQCMSTYSCHHSVNRCLFPLIDTLSWEVTVQQNKNTSTFCFALSRMETIIHFVAFLFKLKCNTLCYSELGGTHAALNLAVR